MSPVESTVVANGLRHHVVTWNEAGAECFVLCHGYLDQAWSFAQVAERLAEAGHRVCAFDWRGHGETEHVGAGGYYHFDDYILDLHELMPSLAGGSKVHLLGHSMGGTATALYAATHPDTLASLTLVEGLGPMAYDKEAPDKLLTWLKSVGRHRKRGSRPMADLLEAVKRLRAQNPELPADLAYFLAETGTVPTEDGSGLLWRFDPLHRTTSPKAFSPEVFAQFLRRVRVPTLIVMGDRGYRTVDHDARVRELTLATEVTLEDASHMIHWLKPDALVSAILGFLRR